MWPIRYLTLTSLLLLAGVVVSASQTRDVMRIGLPNGASPELRVVEHETGTVSLPNVGTFGFVPVVHDDDSVTVTVLDLKDGGRTQIAEVALSAGDVVTTDTAPKFDVRLVHVVRQSDRDPAAPATPIPVKFIGLLEQGNKRVAIFSDGKGQPVYAREGQAVLGQYKLLSVGVESVIMSYLDGKGVQQIKMTGK
jgi:hypothetical protein